MTWHLRRKTLGFSTTPPLFEHVSRAAATKNQNRAQWLRDAATEKLSREEASDAPPIAPEPAERIDALN